MKTNYISKIYSGAIFSGLLLLALFGISASNAKAQVVTGNLTVKKDVCNSINPKTNACNGNNTALSGATIEFTVQAGTLNAAGTTFTGNGVFRNPNIPVMIKVGGSNGDTTVNNIGTAGSVFQVCEITPTGFLSIPQPSGSTQFTQNNCIVLILGGGNNNAQFANISAPVGPTAATVTIGGRVVSPYGRGVARARVLMTDSTGQIRGVMTNPFGYYTFNDVEVGNQYILEVKHRRYSFTQQALSLTEQTTVNFTADR